MRLSEKPVLRLVLDTNILISALLRKNTPPYLPYQAWRENQFELVTSPKQLEELQRVIEDILIINARQALDILEQRIK